MDKETKKKIQRLWRNRLLVGVFSIGLFGSSLGLFRSTLKHRPQQPSWVLELSQSVEDLKNENSSIEQKELALDEILEVCEKFQLSSCLPNAKSLSKDGYQYKFIYELKLYKKVGEEKVYLYNYGEAIKSERYQKKVQWQESQQETLWKSLWEKLQNIVRQNLWEKKRMIKLAQEADLMLIIYEHSSLESIITKELEYKYNLKLVQGSDLESYLNNEPERERLFVLSVTFLSLSVLVLLVSLFTLTKLQSSYNLPPNSHLIAFLPEEYVAEMGALAGRMKKANASPWEIRLRLLEEFVTLIWVFYIQIKLENLSLPFQDNQIDE